MVDFSMKQTSLRWYKRKFSEYNETILPRVKKGFWIVTRPEGFPRGKTGGSFDGFLCSLRQWEPKNEAEHPVKGVILKAGYGLEVVAPRLRTGLWEKSEESWEAEELVNIWAQQIALHLCYVRVSPHPSNSLILSSVWRTL